MAVDTAKVTGRRTLQFHSYDEILADVEQLAASPSLKSLGNWSLGQTLYHLTAAANMSLDGANSTVPWFIRLLGRMLRNRVLTRPMSAGFRLPPNAQAELVAQQPVETDAAVAALRASYERLAREPQRKPHPVFGDLTREQWDQLHWRHAELHLSFYLP